MPSIDLGSRSVEYEVVRGNSTKYTYFRFRPDLTLEVVLPRKGAMDVVRAINDRRDWIRSEFDRISKVRNVLESGAVMFNGRQLRVFHRYSAEDRIIPDLENDLLEVRSTDQTRLRELVRRWFLRESSAYAVRKVSELASKVGAKPSRVDVREIGKWGYCTKGGRLSFSWQLIALPEKLREYVVLHELTHLLEFNHSNSFRRRLRSVCPDFRERERELDLIAPYDRLALG